MAVTNISEANSQLSALVERVLAGEEIIIGKAGKPVAKLVPFERPAVPRVPSLPQRSRPRAPCRGDA